MRTLERRRGLVDSRGGGVGGRRLRSDGVGGRSSGLRGRGLGSRRLVTIDKFLQELEKGAGLVRLIEPNADGLVFGVVVHDHLVVELNVLVA